MPKVCPVCDTVYADTNAFCPVDGTTLHVVDLEGGLIGSVVADRYLVTDLLGEGGMGKVYLARHVRLPQQAAIKVLRPDMVRDPAAVARFNREASNASRIDDENVARVYDFGEAAGGTVYLAMEYVAGLSLRDLITRDGALPPKRAAGIVEQIARGLDAAHRLKIIHRDLKPDNILVIEGADGRDRVKVVDFGIAKAFGADGGNLTKTGFVVGTPEFMSPEQLMGMPLDARSDVYALALVAYQCLTAALPFPGDTPEQAMTGRLTRPPRPLREVSAKDWPPALQQAFDAALSREVQGRPESAGAFAKMLSSAIEGWTPSDVGGVAPPPPRSNRTVPMASTPTVVETQTAQRPQGAGRGSKGGIIAAVLAVVAIGGFFAYRNFAGAPSSPAVAANTSPSTDSASLPAAASQPAPDSQLSPPSSPSAPNAVQIAAAVRDSIARESAARARRDSLQKQQAASKAGTATTASAPAANASNPARADSARATPAAPPPAPVETSLRDSLTSLAAGLKPGIDRVTAGRIADALRKLAPRITDPSLRATAYFRLIDASAKSGGDIDDMCASYRAAKSAARGDAQLAELRRFEQRLGCS